MTCTRIVVATLGLTLTLGCAGSPTQPTPGPGPGGRTGTWLGTLTDAANGAGTLRVVLQETPVGAVGLLGGTWSATFGSGAAPATGDVTGTISGTVVQFTLRRTVPTTCATSGPLAMFSGAFIAQNLALAGTTISGAYDYQACSAPVPGTLELRQQ